MTSDTKDQIAFLLKSNIEMSDLCMRMAGGCEKLEKRIEILELEVSALKKTKGE